MKNFFVYALLFVLPLTFFSCNEKDDPKDEYIISDWYPVELKIFISDKNAADLLDEVSENYAGEDFTLTYQNKAYSVAKQKVSKAYMPVFEGLVLKKDEESGKFYAYFGELDGYADYEEDFIIQWKDGTKDVIHFSRKITGSLDSDDKWLLNGEDTKQNRPLGIFTIEK
jgi:hypothetical protein